MSEATLYDAMSAWMTGINGKPLRSNRGLITLWIKKHGEENVRGTKNTHARGASNPGAKLSPHQVDEIRRDNRRTKELVSAYGVNRSTVQRIRNGSLWPTMVKP